jgi:ABC-type multidrug transport system fused ATPase/permease subunit
LQEVASHSLHFPRLVSEATHISNEEVALRLFNMYQMLLLYFLAYIYMCEIQVSHAYSCGTMLVKPELRNRIVRPVPLRHTRLLAKKKGNKLISDDLLASLYDEEDTAVKSTPPSMVANAVTVTNTVTKDKKKKHKLLSDDLLKLIVKEDVGGSLKEQNHSTPPPQRQKLREAKMTSAGSTEEAVLAVPHPEVSTKVRKDKPSSRIRFVESSQPDFVSLGLDKVSVAFGDEVVVKDGTFSVSSGERVGLVGPNGAGKVRT